MKNYYLILTALLFFTLQLKAQTPNALNYQGVARNASGLVLPNQSIGLRFTIHQGSAGGTIAYQETQTTTTNQLGLFTVFIGSGTVVSGSFATIAWGSNTEYLQVEMDPAGGSAYVNMGTNQFLSVPYALNAGASNTSWNVTGNSATGGTDYIGTSDPNDLIMKANNTEIERLANSTGNVGIGTSTPNAGAELDVSSSTKGLLIPRMTANPTSPAQGMMYYNTSTGCFMFYTGSIWQAMVCPCPNVITTPAIVGPTTVCANTPGLVYSVAPLSNATSYTWVAPTNGTITGGQGSNIVTITTGALSSPSVKVTASNNCGSSTQASLTLTASDPVISSQPRSLTLSAPATATFSVTSSNALSYQWQVSTNSGSSYSPIDGATTNSYVINPTSAGMTGNLYKVAITGLCSTINSNAATLTVCAGAPGVPGAISGSVSFCAGTTGLVYSITPTANSTSYTWTVPAIVGSISSGQGTSAITVTGGSVGGSGNISVVAINACSTSSASTLPVVNGSITAISTQPASQSVITGSPATFTVTAAGGSLTYQWLLNSGSGYAPVTGATNNSYTISSPTTGMSGNQYEVTVNGTCGGSALTSTAAGLTVCPGTLGTPGSISGPTTFCPATLLAYSIPSVANASSYTWSVPAGVGTILAGAGTNAITVTASTTSGSISVTPVNGCATGSASSLALTANTGTNITVQPVNAASTGGNVAFTVQATGTSLTYQWQVSTDGGNTYNPLSNVAPYSNVTTASLAITSPTNGMNGYLYEVVVGGAGATCNTVTSTPATLGICTNASVQIAVANTAAISTSANLTVQLSVNFSLYTNNGEVANLNNIEFTVGASAINGGTPLYAWIESGSAAVPATAATSSSTAAIVWVNLGSNTIAGGGSLNIYMNFMGTTVMSGPTSYTGMAPNISGTYAQFDNGALVFPTFYDNFAGTSLDANWTHYSSGTGTFTINNGLTISFSSGAQTQVITSASSYPPPLIAEGYVQGTAGLTGTRSYMPGLISNTATVEGNNIDDQQSSPYNTAYLSFSNGRSGATGYYWLQQAAGLSGNYGLSSTTPTGYNLFGLYYNPTANSVYKNYTNVAAATASFSPAGNSMYFALGMQNGQSATETLNAYWTRIRVYPPSGTAPTVSIGSIGCY